MSIASPAVGADSVLVGNGSVNVPAGVNKFCCIDELIKTLKRNGEFVRATESSSGIVVARL